MSKKQATMRHTDTQRKAYYRRKEDKKIQKEMKKARRNAMNSFPFKLT